MILLDGKKVSSLILNEVKKRVFKLRKDNIIPILAVISFGNDMDSLLYRKMKRKACLEVGIEYKDYHFSDVVDTNSVIQVINELNHNDNIWGIIIDKPIPSSIDSNALYESIDPSLDVDCLTSTNLDKIKRDNTSFIPSTTFGILKLLDYYHINVQGLKTIIIGKTNSKNKPLSILLNRKGALVMVCSKDDIDDNSSYIKNADIIISAVGERYITGEIVKNHVIVLDVGIHYEDGKVCGDVFYDDVSKIASYITPVPFGIGPMTIAMLLYQLIILSNKCKKGDEDEEKEI